MYRKILIPIDGSKLAELALPYAECLARTFGSEVILLSIVESTDSEYQHMHQLYVEKLADLVKQNIESNTAATVKPVILTGKPAKEIIDYAEQNDIRLIIMASHGRTGIKSWAMGSVANNVLERTSIPILLVRAKTPCTEESGEKLFSRILIPLDGSENGEAALAHIQELSNELQTEVTLLQVISDRKHVHTIGGQNIIRFTKEQIESTKIRTIKYLEEVCQRLTNTKAVTKCEVHVGEAAEEIIKFADNMNASLVALSHQGHTGLGQSFMGGVAHKILHSGNKPVLLVKKPGKQS